MALVYRVINRNIHYFENVTKPVKWSCKNNSQIRLVCIVSNRNIICKTLPFTKNVVRTPCISPRSCSTQTCTNGPPQNEPPKKQGLVQRFKQMYKDYWYVLLPVHMTTSAIWFGGFYYCVRSGVDIISIMQSIGVSEKLLTPLRESTAGYFALAFACYKLVTPLRYAVTVGGTTYAIKKLTGIGWIKPVPSRERIKEMLQEKKDNIQDKFNESKQHYQIQIKEKGTQIKEKGTQMMDEMRRYKTEMRNIKDKMKKM